MRFLHTADWHVGKPLRGRSRMEEYAAALEEVAAVAVDRKVDAVLVAGDIFDSPAPPPDAEKLVYDFLARLVSERIPAVLIAGNHDHPRKLGALASLLAGLQIHVRPEVRPPGEGGVVRSPPKERRHHWEAGVRPRCGRFARCLGVGVVYQGRQGEARAESFVDECRLLSGEEIGEI